MNFFTADPHYFHKIMLEKCRGHYATVAAMNTDIVSKWNDVVSNSDTVYVLGDLSFGKAQETREIVSYLQGHKVLVLGNHDNRSKTAYLKMGFEDVCESMRITIKGTQFLLSHYPYQDGQIERHRVSYGELFTPASDLRLLHGHVHSQYKQIKENALNVGVDVWDYYPVTEEQVLRAFGLTVLQ